MQVAHHIWLHGGSGDLIRAVLGEGLAGVGWENRIEGIRWSVSITLCRGLELRNVTGC